MRTIALIALCAAGLSQAQTKHTLELPQADRVTERASVKHVTQIRYEPPEEADPPSERTTSWRLELDYTDLGDRGLEVARARTWGPAPRAPAAPGAAPKPKQVETTLPCEGQTAPRDAFPHLAWGDEHPLQGLLPGRRVAVGERWTPGLDAVPAVLGSLASQRIGYTVEHGSLEATLQSVEDGVAVLGFTLKLTYAAPKPERGIPLSLDFAASLEATGTLRLESKGVQLVLDGALQVKEHYTSGAPPDGKFDHTVTLHRELERAPKP